MLDRNTTPDDVAAAIVRLDELCTTRYVEMPSFTGCSGVPETESVWRTEGTWETPIGSHVTPAELSAIVSMARSANGVAAANQRLSSDVEELTHLLGELVRSLPDDIMVPVGLVRRIETALPRYADPDDGG